MACTTSSITLQSYEDPDILHTTSSRLKPTTSHVPATGNDRSTSPSPQSSNLRQRRRHSSYHGRSWSVDQENVQLLLDKFLHELGRRLDFLEDFGQLNVHFSVGGGSIQRAWMTLHTVRDSCAHVSDEVIGAGRRRAKILVDTLDEHYRDALARKETLEQKVQEGVRMMETLLEDFEARAYTLRDSHIAAANDFFDESWRRVDSGFQMTKTAVDDGIERARRAKDSLKAKIEYAIQAARERGLLAYDELPEPWRINPHILRGYRFSETKVDCVRSTLSFSNEFFNIWSHIAGFIVVLSVAFYFYPSSSNFVLSTKSDVFIAAVFFAAAAKCLICSVVWHTMSSIAEQKLMEQFACIDYTGISLLVATSILTTEYTAFYCEPVSRWTYMLMTLGLGIAGTILPWHPTFNRADMAWARVAFYVGLSATGTFPVVQLVMTRGLEWALYFYAPITKSLVVYLVGASLYAGKIPEKWWPGMFDYVGGSHNIWHVAVLGGILFHYVAMQEFFRQAFERARVGACSVY